MDGAEWAWKAVIKGWRALGDQAEEMGSVPGFGWGRPEHEMVWAVLGASVRHSARGKGHEEGGSIYAKAGSSLRSPPGNSQASTPITRACLLYYFVLSPTPLTLQGAVPHHLFRKRSPKWWWLKDKEGKEGKSPGK